MRRLAILATSACMAIALAPPSAAAVRLDFEDLAPGTVLFDQYAGRGVLFLPNALSGPGGPNGDWASNTDMTVVSSAGSDVGELGGPPLVSGNVLRSFDGWLAEDGDASFRLAFSTAVRQVSVDFAGVGEPENVHLFAFSGSTLLADVTASTLTGQYALAFSAPAITSVVITPGSYADWVALDNIGFAPVPEPAAAGLLALGLAGLALARRSAGQCGKGLGCPWVSRSTTRRTA